MTADNHRVLLFDIDCTLLDPAGEGCIYFSRALIEVFGTAGPIVDFSMAGKTDWQIVTELMTLAGVSDERIDAGLEATFAAYARTISEADLALKMRVLPGVQALLSALSQRPEFALGLVTGNVREAVPHKLRAVGIDPAQFTFGAYGSERLHRNELPGLALSRLAELSGGPVDRERVLVIGDTARDIECARHAGVKVMVVATGHSSVEELAEHQPDYILEDLTDAEAVMRIFKSF
jgi:phosphoglycolate phosphatase-like HAD superfamily hydrolase